MTTIYGVYRSRASRNYWLVRELGLTVEEVPVIQAYRLPDPAAADAPLNTRSTEFLEITVAGAVPALKDNGFVLTESLAINLYLAKKHGGHLAPADLREEALMMQWALYGATSLEPPALAMLYAFMEGGEDTDDGRAEIEARAEEARRPLKVIDAHLASESYMVGSRFTVADINMAEIVRYAAAHPTLVAEFPAVERWLTACQSRAAFQAMMEKRNTEPL